MSDIVKNPYEWIIQKCAENNVSLSDVCRKCDIDYENIRRWREKAPKSIEILQRIEEYFKKLED